MNIGEDIENGVDRGVRDAVEVGVLVVIFAIVRKLGWYSLFIFFPVFCFIIWLFSINAKSEKEVALAKRSMYDSVKIGDSVFVAKANSLDTGSGIRIFQLYRPEQSSDIQKMKLPVWKKKQLIDKLDTLEKNSCETVYELRSNEIYQRNSAYIGTVIGKDSTMMVDAPGGYDNMVLEIKPYKKVYDKNTRLNSNGTADIYPLKRFYVSSRAVDTVDFLKAKKK